MRKEEGPRNPLKEQRQGRRAKQPHFSSDHRYRAFSEEKSALEDCLLRGHRLLYSVALEVPYRKRAGGTGANRKLHPALAPGADSNIVNLYLDPWDPASFGTCLVKVPTPHSFSHSQKNPKKERVNHSRYSPASKDVSENAKQAKIKTESGDSTQAPANLVMVRWIGL